MEELWQAIRDFFKNFASDGGLVIVRTVAFALLGLVILKIVRSLTRRAALRSKLDNAAATFVISLITVLLYIALVTPGGTVSADVRAVSYIGIPLAMMAVKAMIGKEAE